MTGAHKTWLAPAKLNLFLHVTGQRADGYHTLQTAFIFLDYYDTLQFEINPRGDIYRVDAPNAMDLRLPKEDLCTKAARLLKKHSGVEKGVKIMLEKRIPAGAGLGGGSSDAATALIALNQLWGLNLPKAELMALGRQLGADVPVFIYGENTLAEGVGDEFAPLEIEQKAYYVLIPTINVSTKQIFSDSALTRDTPIKTIRGSLPLGLNNDLQDITCKRYPAVKRTIDWLSQFGDARMSGTGASVFLACDTLDEAKQIDEKWRRDSSKNLAKEMRSFVAMSLLTHPH